LEDAEAALDWLHAVGRAAELPVDPARIALVGHSMGGFIAAHIAARGLDILATALISAVDLRQELGRADRSHGAAAVDENVGISAGLHILAGTSPELLAAEARRHAQHWRLSTNGPRLANRPLLVISSDDGFAASSEALATKVGDVDAQHLRRVHLASDHSYSGCRIALQKAILSWLIGLEADSGAGNPPPAA
jgi:pimeloyl-ACP methyl ester carboxylesterase